MAVLKIVKTDKTLRDPSYALEGDAGLDIFSAENAILLPLERKLINSGIKLQISHGYEVQIRPKSGLVINQGLTVLNSPGTIDSNYRGDIKIIVFNASNESIKVEKGQKIAQLVVNKIEIPKIEFVEDLDNSNRNQDGFGSTGL